MADTKTLIDSLSDEDKAALFTMSKEALQVEEQRLAFAKDEWV